MAKKSVVAPVGWRNRIVGEDVVNPTTLVPNPQNWRIHGSLQSSALACLLGEVGWVQRILVNCRSGTVVDGHLRLKLALDHHEPQVPVLYVDLAEDEERLVLATLDPLTALAEADRGLLKTLLDDVHSTDRTVQQMLSQLADSVGIGTALGDDATENGTRAARKDSQPVHIAVAVADVAIVEQALRATGLPNRGEALLQMCTAFLEAQDAHAQSR